ncbi:Gag-Pol polyprotein [Gossypium australe]|uniref:Gag-Pol polyprotein n=1 Tax=Gossypium australe TaxID=47621 RepID=A0A5B6X1M8_9ROSI|nr:Gag-Pol polyprotein [Gossypium australe]
MDPKRAVADAVESNAPALAQGTAPSNSRLVTSGQEGEAKQAFSQMMSEWFTQFVRNNPTVSQPPPPISPPQTSVVPLVMYLNLLNKLPVDKICKYGAEEFRATSGDDVEKSEFWLENTIRVFDEMSLPPEEKFVRLSQYARECVSTEAIMCKRFEDGLNEDIHSLVGIVEIKEFVVLIDRACKAEALEKDKRKAESEVKDVRKRFPSKSFQSTSKKFRNEYSRSKANVGHSSRDLARSQMSSKTPATSMVSVGNVQSEQPECKHCGKRHPGSCRLNDWACFKCGSLDHFIRDCPESVEPLTTQNPRSDNAPMRGRPSQNVRNVSGSQRSTRDNVARSEARAPTRAYAIRAREVASSPDVKTGTYILYDTSVIALIDPSSTHSYICMNLLSSTAFPVKSTEFVIKVSNPLGKSVLVDKVCKNCPLMFPDICFPAGLMLLQFDEFDIILGMDWLTLHDAIVNCKRKTIDLRCPNDEIVRVESMI